ncbi:hypothetical protein M404DRAFT_1007996 [Pisolithus tinctorius Marx 270]|uniref:Uncharacterized protein n=1 Tax=Pisolithus tinctorius Marx 270 TaxID=870435 RepID=A0A0C3NHF5_PISTI|nr:hypothetical protein M404DRAFT_1007996 [Pisolithus tinctorius Marx 270]
MVSGSPRPSFQVFKSSEYNLACPLKTTPDLGVFLFCFVFVGVLAASSLALSISITSSPSLSIAFFPLPFSGALLVTAVLSVAMHADPRYYQCPRRATAVHPVTHQ